MCGICEKGWVGGSRFPKVSIPRYTIALKHPMFWKHRMFELRNF